MLYYEHNKIQEIDMNKEDLRWKYRFSSFNKALKKLEEGVELALTHPLSDIEKQGLIKAFEFTHELAWNLLKDFLESKGIQNLFGPKDTVQESFRQGLIKKGDVWMNMIKDRNLTSHIYNEEISNEIVTAIINIYFLEFKDLQATFEKFKNEEEL